MGPNAFKFVDLLKEMKQTYWQILPLCPTGYGNSPYAGLSAFAGNPNLISLDYLLEMKLLDDSDIANEYNFSTAKVEFQKVVKFKERALKLSFNKFQESDSFDLLFQKFENKSIFWLDNFTTYMALKLEYNEKPWIEWPKMYHQPNSEPVEEWKIKNPDKIKYQKFIQFIFDLQWSKLKKYANDNGIYIIGDLPLYVQHDSSDVWTQKKIFKLNENYETIYVAGVPPDGLSAIGQRWGNPVYSWEANKKDGFKWWMKRLNHCIEIYDLTRLDHFIGYERYWEINAKEPTAVKGQWLPGPRSDIFDKLLETQSYLPFISEDLGLVTEEVFQLRDKYNFPGMKIIQFAFSPDWDPNNTHLPHTYSNNSVAYTSTHDTDTLNSWFKSISDELVSQIKDYYPIDDNNSHFSFIRLIWGSSANTAIVQLQDLLNLDKTHRMNWPGTLSDNWEWRFTWDQISDTEIDFIKSITKLYGRSE
jgi:4-alpha-glucanotransferase